MAFRENYTQPAEEWYPPRAAMADPQVVNCNRFSYQQVIHILPSLRAPKLVLDFDRPKDRLTPSEMPGSIYPKSVHPVRQVHL